MLSFDATQLAIVAADNKAEISWLFQIDRTGNDVVNDYWSTKTKTWDGHDYIYKITDFSEAEMNRAQSESGIQAPSEFTFTIHNKNNVLTTADFSSARVNLLLVVKAGANEAVMRSWSFRITEIDPGYQKLVFHCVDWLQAFLEGDYPNTTTIESIFWGQQIKTFPYLEVIKTAKEFCIPLVLGRPCIPIMPVYFPAPSYFFGYLLGPTTGTPADYDVYNVKTPTDWGGEAKTFSKADYTFNYIDKTGLDGNDYTFGEFICLDYDRDGVLDACLAFYDSAGHKPIPAEYEEDSKKAITAPANVLEYILEDWGIPSARIDATTQAAANSIYAGWGLTWNTGLFNKESRKKLLARLLQMCHTELIVRDKIYFKVHSKTSQMTVTKASIIKEKERGEGTFKYELIEKKDEKDSGYVSYQVQGECLDHPLKALVTVKGNYNNIASDVVSADYVQDSQAAQKLGILALQRKFLPLAKVSFTLKATCLALECDDVITLDHADYGGTYDVLIDSMTINRDLSIAIEATRFSQALDDWEDLAPGALTVVEDAGTVHLEVVTVGPDALDNAGNHIGNVLKGRLRIGETGNHILFDPVEPIQTFVEGGITRMRIGDLGTDDWGIEFLDHAGTSIFKLDGSGVNTLSGWAVDGQKFTCQSGQVGMNAEVTGGVDWRFWAGHATPGSAPFRVDENGNLYCTLIYASGGTIGGWTIGATKLSITGIELDQANNRIRAYTGDNYVDMTAAGLTGYDSVLGTTFTLPTNGDAPEFSSGIIKECVYEIYTSGVIRTNADPATNGGLIINNTDLKGYTSAGLKILQFIYDGTDQGDAYIGDYDNTNPGLKYDHSAGELNFRGNIKVLAGGDIIMTPSDTNPSILKFSTAHNIGAGNTAARGLCLWPTTENQDYLSLGFDPVNNVYKKYYRIYNYVYHDWGVTSLYDATHYAKIAARAVSDSASIKLTVKNGATEYALTFYGDPAVLLPSVTGAIDLGNDAFKFKNGYLAGYMAISGTPGGVPVANAIYKDNIVKGWIRFDGTGTISITDSFNVSSIADGGTGIYTLTWDRDFANNDYVVAGSASVNRRVSISSFAVGSVVINIHDDAATFRDDAMISVIAIGDQT